MVPTCWTGIPFETARAAYFADKTWPLELRKGYTSPTNALIRIPFEEGPLFLFKGGYPIAMHSFIFWTAYFTIYSFMKNKFFFFFTYNDFSYDFVKSFNMVISFFLASSTAYPAFFVRELVDIWPKERGGHCTWRNNHRECFKWMIDNIDTQMINMLRGYWGWFRTYGIMYFIGLWMADTYGMFTNCNEAWASLEMQFPIFSEAS